VNDEESFLGSGPAARPLGLDPFAGKEDTSIEGEVALEMLPKMARSTSTYQVSTTRSYVGIVVAVVLALLAGAVAYIMLRQRAARAKKKRGPVANDKAPSSMQCVFLVALAA
jgi:hypothetical protein